MGTPTFFFTLNFFYPFFFTPTFYTPTFFLPPLFFFLPEKNPTSIFKIGGILAKKIFRKFLETSVISSFQRGDSRYFGKKFQKLFQVDTNPTLSFKIGGILAKKIVRKFLETSVKSTYDRS